MLYGPNPLPRGERIHNIGKDRLKLVMILNLFFSLTAMSIVCILSRFSSTRGQNFKIAIYVHNSTKNCT